MSLLKRTMDATFLNVVVNDPDVRPWLGGEGEIDVSGLLAYPNNIALVGEHGGFIGERREPALIEVHTQILPSGRGGWAISATEEALRYVFTRTEIETVTTRVPADNKPALLLTRHMGFQESFRRADAWTLADGTTCEMIYFALTFDRWRGRDKTLVGEGQAFHEALEAAKAAWGSTLPVHPDDEAHDRAVGASVAMIRAGNPVRAVVSYNRWAQLSGYASIELLSVVPAVIDVRDAIVTNCDGEMQILAMPKGG